MNKMNKKGFTLIEMLVVIAIIAVLVAIIIPTVSSATTKAKAAADAANLRSLVAEATTDLLAGNTETEGLVSFTAPVGNAAVGSGNFKVNDTAPKSKSQPGEKATIKYNADGTLDAYFKTEGKNIAYYAGVADGSQS